MMNAEKQIEEMAKVICDCCRTDGDCSNVAKSIICNAAYQEAEALKTAGYRRASEVASEIFEVIEKYLVTGSTFYGQAVHSIGVGVFAKLKKRYTEGEG